MVMAGCICWLHPAIPVRLGRVLSGRGSLRRGIDRLHKSQLTRRKLVTRSHTVIGNQSIVSQDNKIWLPSQEYTHNLGRLLGQDSRPGDVILLHGDLGAGKTALARGYVHAALDDSMIQVTSPTYLLTNVYPGATHDVAAIRPDIYHMDLWRLQSATDRPIVDFEQVFTSAVSLIEWPDRLGELTPKHRLDLLLEYPPPVEQDGSDSADDPWGFGSGEPDDMDSSRSGRFATFVAHGDEWKARVKNIYDHAAMNEDGKLLIRHT